MVFETFELGFPNIFSHYPWSLLFLFMVLAGFTFQLTNNFILTSEILILTTKNIFLSLILFPAACPCLKDIVSQILVMMFGVLKVISFELSQFPTKYVIYVGLGCSPWNCHLSSASLSSASLRTGTIPIAHLHLCASPLAPVTEVSISPNFGFAILFFEYVSLTYIYICLRNNYFKF